MMASILPAARDADQATKTIPIVFVIVSDPVGSGPAASLAHPGRNLTGMSNVSEDLTAKRVQTFKETLPNLKRMGLIVHPGGQSPERVFDEYRAAAAVLGIETVVLEARSPADLDIAMDSARTEHLDAVAAAPDSMIFNSRGRLADLAIKSGLPYMGTNLDDATAGALLAYGPNHADIFRRSAAVVDKILKGEKPGDIPVQQTFRPPKSWGSISRPSFLPGPTRLSNDRSVEFGTFETCRLHWAMSAFSGNPENICSH